MHGKRLLSGLLRHIKRGTHTGRCGIIYRSALRELKEELDLTIDPAQLIDCGLHRHHADEVFHGERFLDNQISKVFLLWLDVDEADITVQKEEIDSVKWFDYAECKQDVINGTIPNCIDVAELEMLEPHFAE